MTGAVARLRRGPSVRPPETWVAHTSAAAADGEAESSASGSTIGSEQVTPRQIQAVGRPPCGSRPASQLGASPGGGAPPGAATTTASAGPSTRRARVGERARRRIALGSHDHRDREAALGGQRRPRERREGLRRALEQRARASRSRAPRSGAGRRGPTSSATRSSPSTASPVECGVAPSWSERGRCTSGSPSDGVRKRSPSAGSKKRAATSRPRRPAPRRASDRRRPRDTDRARPRSSSR